LHEERVRLSTRIFTVAAIVLPAILTSRVDAQAADTSYTLTAGTYSGATIDVRRSTALRKGSAFWRLAPKTDGRLVGWNPSRFPVGVGLRTGQGIQADDSIAFWKTLRGMEQDLGMHLFEPAVVSSSDDPRDVIVVGLQSMRGDDGRTYITWSNDGSLYDARVFFQSRDVFHDERVVQHEMMHALGFGHTSSWVSIMNVVPGARRLTAEDVAYAQVALRSRAETERVDVWERIALAVEHSSPAVNEASGYAPCDFVSPYPVEEDRMKVKQIASFGLVGVIAACSAGNRDKKADTIAVPAAAVDTTNNRPPGGDSTTSVPATGVDTPITKKIGSPAPVKH
jgi:hypothetical protein